MTHAQVFYVVHSAESIQSHMKYLVRRASADGIRVLNTFLKTIIKLIVSHFS